MFENLQQKMLFSKASYKRTFLEEVNQKTPKMKLTWKPS